MPLSIDRGFVLKRVALLTTVALLVSVPLVLYRAADAGVWGPSAWAAAGLLVVLWSVGEVVRQRRTHQEHDDRCRAADSESTSWTAELLTIGLLIALTGVAFHLPMQQCYWRGADDAGLFWVGDENPVWSTSFDSVAGRPMQMFVAPPLSRAITPGRVEGYLWVSDALWFLSAWLLFLIVRKVVPDRPQLAAMAAVLFIVSPTEPSRFYLFSVGMSYTSSLTMLLFSFWLLLRSLERERLSWLLGACVALGATLLSNEGQFPLAVVGFALIAIHFRGRSFAIVAGYAWFATMLLLTVRFIGHLVSAQEQSYQARQAGETFRDPALVVEHLLMQVGAIREYVNFGGLRFREGLIAGLAAVVASLAVCRLQTSARRPSLPDRKRLGLGLLLAGTAVLLGVVPFLHMFEVFRTQYFALTGQAVIVAILITLLASRLPLRYSRACEFACVGLLVLNSTLAAYRLQATRFADPSFDRMTHVLQQIHGIAPQLADDEIAVLVHETEHVHPLACNYCLNRIADLLLETSVVQANYADTGGDLVEFGVDGIRIRGGLGDYLCRVKRGELIDGAYEFPYQKVVAFSMSQDGNLRLLEELPFRCLPEGAIVDQYQPLQLLGATQPAPIRFFRYESSFEVPIDVIPTASGIVLDDDWSLLCRDGEFVCRSGGSDASILINPRGETHRTIGLDVAPAGEFEGHPARYVVVNQAGEELADFAVDGPQRIELEIPLEPSRINAVSFVPVTSDGRRARTSDACICLTASADRADRLQRRLFAQPLKGENSGDIHDASLRLGANWHGLTTSFGPVFRWVDTNAEVIVPGGATGFGMLELEIERGPSYGPGPLELRVLDAGENEVCRSMTGERTAVRFPLPLPKKRPTKFLLAADGDRLPIPNDPLLLNFRVFRARFEPIDADRYRELLAELPAGPQYDRDISDDSLVLGRNWGKPVERGNDLFRWVDTDAEVQIAPDDLQWGMLEFDIEKGPSYGPGPCDLQLLGGDGELLATARVRGREVVRFPLELGDRPAYRFRLCTGGERRPVKGQSRCLNFAVHAARFETIDESQFVELAAALKLPALNAPDIHDGGVKLGRNWHRPAGPGDAVFRWVDSDAEIVVPPGQGSRLLSVDVEAGPSCGRRPTSFRVTAEDGTEIGVASFAGRRRLEISIPPTRTSQVYRLNVESERRPIPNDSRILNFRVFAIRSVGRGDVARTPVNATNETRRK